MTGSAAGVERVVYSSWGLQGAAFLARLAPAPLGYALARQAARFIAGRTDSPPVAAVRGNQGVISGSAATSPALDPLVTSVFHHAARSVYELYHYSQQPAALEEMYTFDPSFEPVARRPEFAERGLLIAGLHMAGFDLGLRCLCRYKFKPLVLTMANPRAGRRLELEGRRQMQMNVLTYSINALRTAVRHLQQGGMVLSGIDHPVPGSGAGPCFFGRPALLPSEHIYLAMRARVPVVLVGSRLEADGRYHIHASAPVEMEPRAGRAQELRLNTEKVLALAEQFIRKAPDQWLIFQPVWPLGSEPSTGTAERVGGPE